MIHEYLTSGEAAKILGITPDGIRAMERRGGVKCIKTATGLRLFVKSDIVELASKRALKPHLRGRLAAKK